MSYEDPWGKPARPGSGPGPGPGRGDGCLARVWRWTAAPLLRALRAAGRWVRREVLHPVRQVAADARRTVRVALSGAPAARGRPGPSGATDLVEREAPPGGGTLG
jgi:hypothetical protein